MIRHITLPFSKEAVSQIRCGDILYLTGTVYTARDAAHKRMYDAICAYKDAHKDDLFEEKITGKKVVLGSPEATALGNILLQEKAYT